MALVWHAFFEIVALVEINSNLGQIGSTDSFFI
jgi:hypothetical protein